MLVNVAPSWNPITPVLMMFFPPLILIATALHGSSGEWFNERTGRVEFSSGTRDRGARKHDCGPLSHVSSSHAVAASRLAVDRGV